MRIVCVIHINTVSVLLNNILIKKGVKGNLLIRGHLASKMEGQPMGTQVLILVFTFCVASWKFMNYGSQKLLEIVGNSMHNKSEHYVSLHV